ncbi:alpha/beta fold hydrolase [uncultured Cohaesibacter sp.]|uniref:alpha/beta fold hydrolase n=1 Tax=uncultured Cohaesibacter sp. TaxID=1002546 RepID=UPI00292E9AB4|nr:alpha/beta fold hydrolase [uncultured Cohaesibacter sp.]
MKAGGKPCLSCFLRAFFLCLAVFGLLAVSARAEDSHTPLEPIECPGSRLSGEQAVCFILHVPADWNDIAHRSLQLPVMRFAPLGPKATKPPLLVLAGGPGQSVIRLEKSISRNLKFLRKDRELILMDQRGTGPLAGDIACAEAIRKGEEIDMEAAVKCVKRSEEAGRLLSDYRTAFAVEDYRALRYALKIETWAVIANSYGARVAQGLIGRDEKGIDRVIFNGPLFAATRLFDWKPDEQIDKVIELCDAQDKCRSDFPNLYWDYQRLGFDMRKARVADEEATPPAALPFLYQTRLNAFLARHKAKQVPADITRTVQSLDKALAEDSIWTPPPPLPQPMKGIGLLMHLAISCAEDVHPLADQALYEMAQPMTLLFYRDACEQIENATANTIRPDMVSGKAAKSNLPILVLNGELDTIVNPEAMASTLPLYSNAIRIEMPYAGHDVLSKLSCARSIAAQFLDGAKADALDRGCLRSGDLAFSSLAQK